MTVTLTKNPLESHSTCENPSNSDPGFVRNPGYKGKGLELQFTVQDADVFTMPWSARIIYQRPLGDWPEMVCAENPHRYFPGKKAAIPTADQPDF